MLITKEDKIKILNNRIAELEAITSAVNDTLSLQKAVDPNNTKLLERTQKMIDNNAKKIKALEKELAIVKEMV